MHPNMSDSNEDKIETVESYFATGKNALKEYSEVDHSQNYALAKGYSGDRTFISTDTDISVRSAYDRRDYDYYRQIESTPKLDIDRINLCLRLYKDNGILHNVIDLMGDFASQGIRLQHPVPIVNRFYQTWAHKAGLKERSERIVNYVLKGGTAIIKKDTVKIKGKTEKNFKSVGEDMDLVEKKVNKREIPIRYTLFLPNQVEVLGGQLANFVGKPMYAIKLPTSIVTAMSSIFDNNDEYLKYLTTQIPEEIRKKIQNGEKYIVPDQDKLSIIHYKKDDNEVWADPLARPIISDLIQLEKYKLADNNALDGVSAIRLWNLGILGTGIHDSLLPKKAMFDKLRNILANIGSGGIADLVWGPELKVTETKSESWRFLGAPKYEPVWNAIYDGLGLPPSMRTAGSKATGTGNYVGLNTLIKRLQYVRDLLVSFWREELRLIHEAMDFPGKPPEIIFDFMVFADEAAEKQLWLNMWDRNIVSTETIQEVFSRYPAFEKNRIKKEYKAMENGTFPDKAGPFHNGEKDHDLKKIILQAGDVTPSEVGVVLEPRKAGEKTRVDVQAETDVKKATIDSKTKIEMGHPPQPKIVMPPTGIAGRPKNKIETKKRKPKPKGKPSTKAAIMTWTKSAYNDISNILTPILLQQLGKSNARKLTSEEAESVELVKFGVLCDVEPLSEITEESVAKALSIESGNLINFKETVDEARQTFSLLNNGKETTQEELRNIYTNVYSVYLMDKDSNSYSDSDEE